MLTASLQSTWESQRAKPKPRYGNSSYQNYSGDDNESKNNNQGNINDRMLSGKSLFAAPASNPNGRLQDSHELPNLRVPQQMNMGRVNLGVANTSVNLSGLNNSGMVPLGATLSSPRTNSQMRDLVNGGNRKYRGSSRQNQNRGNRRNKYGDQSGYPGPGDASAYGGNSNRVGQISSDSQILPQIIGPSSNSVILNNGGVSAGNSAVLNASAAMKRNAYLIGGGGPSQNSPSNSHYGAMKEPAALHTSSVLSSQAGNSSNNYSTTEEHAGSAVYSIRGLKPGNPNWINQDNFFVIEGFDNRDIKLYCVLDGHGENGHHVSRRCREAFPQFIRSTNMDMDHAFNMMQNDLNASDIDVKCSGATCVMASIVGNKLNVYNCGDSRAVLGRRNPNGSISAHALSSDHKPDKPEERKRILSCGGHLGCRQVLVNQGGRGPVSMPVGPCRVWYQHRGETLGLAMSRSLGDAIVHKCGVSSEPEVLEHILDDFDEFAILATDGVWDVVDNNHAVQMVHNFAVRSNNWSPMEAANCICKFARSRWEKLSPMIDDITCIVVKFRR